MPGEGGVARLLAPLSLQEEEDEQESPGHVACGWCLLRGHE